MGNQIEKKYVATSDDWQMADSEGGVKMRVSTREEFAIQRKSAIERGADK